tara:strand:+ start:472 stop:993 length:522 start_codon:yes stop_codon:yes gene_type:complete
MESTNQAPPASFERQLSPQEERDVLINFMGNVYGESKKLDGNVIGVSTTLSNNKSNDIKQHIEELVRKPLATTAPTLPVSLPAPSPVAIVSAPVVIRQPEVLVQQPDIDLNQLSFNFDVNEKDQLFELVNSVLARLDKLHNKVDILTEAVQQSQSVKKKSTPRKKAVKTKKET